MGSLSPQATDTFLRHVRMRCHASLPLLLFHALPVGLDAPRHVLTSCVYSLLFQYNVFLSVLYDAPSHLPVWAKFAFGDRV